MTLQIEKYGINELSKLLINLRIKKWLLVHETSYNFLNIKNTIEEIKIPKIVFNSFTPNPLHNDVDKGTKLFIKENCDAIVAVGGGSSIDVAKCIKMDSNMNVPLIVIPTTAGTGSESTKHIVVYRNGIKESLGNDNTIPNYIIFEPTVLKSLPIYQKKSTLLDALCQAIESWWNVNRTKESIEYSKEAISLIMNNMDSYINDNNEYSASQIMKAANLAGKAINITATTAAHAMSYKITSMFSIPHGNAVAVCLPEVWNEMLSTSNETLNNIFNDISLSLKQNTPYDAINWFKELLKSWNMNYPISNNFEEDISVLTNSVNPVRLKNNPVIFNENTIGEIYRRIVR